MSGPRLYDVFLSFRGPDTRNNFADFLYTRLIDVGIVVFRDEEELERGREISPQLIQAIEQSKISIPVISEEYASSKSCLVELNQMVKCMDNIQQTIIPIFYHVDPSDVSNCRGKFEIADDNQKRALNLIGNLAGHHLVKRSDRRPSEVEKQIVRKVERMLRTRDLILPKELVKVDPHVQEIKARLKIGHRDGQAVKIGDTCEKLLIYGIAGVGKTVLAQCVYNEINNLYDACGFLKNIQEDINREGVKKGVLSVQNTLISQLHGKRDQKSKSSDEALRYIQSRFHTNKFLLLLDDVKDCTQLRTLVGELDWLGPQSTVIVTSRRKDVLQNINGAKSFNLGPMEKDEALKLFCKHAFKTDSPREKFDSLSRKIVAATGGLPFALEQVGSSLFLIKKGKVWRETLNALKVSPPPKVQKALKKSFTNLDKNERKIFLDIACFSIGKDKRIPYYMWADLNHFPSRSIIALDIWSFVKIGENKELCMHEVLKNFGREIVRNENPRKPWKRSRLCDHEEALHVLKRRKGTKKVKALRLEFGFGSIVNTSFECDQFEGLQKLRFLELDRADIQGNFGDCLPSLRWLDWQGCPRNFDVQSVNLKLQNLVILDLSRSQVDKDWEGWKLIVKARKLKVLRLTGCVQLIATPEFLAPMKLERFILEGCSKLAVITPSFGNLEELVTLNMKQCHRLYELPALGPMRSLKELVIDGTSISQINFQEGSMMKLKTLSASDCKNLTDIAYSIGYLSSLKNLTLDGTGIHTLQSIGSLENLETLSLKNCRSLLYLPDRIEKLRSLQFLDLSDTMIEKLPPSVKDLKAMKVLRMRGTLITEFPRAILNLEKLEEIDFSLCQCLEGKIPFNIWRLSCLAILKLSHTQISGLPKSFHRLSHLQELDIFRCDNLRRLPELPSNLIDVRWHKDLGTLAPMMCA